MEEQVILVNENDVQQGVMEKMEAHRKGLLHRAFSVFIFNSNGDLLLQKRAATKYHSAGLWTNTCCSHPAPGEAIGDAAARRLRQEMNLVVPLQQLFRFHYTAELEKGLIENEIDYVLFGCSDTQPVLNTQEAEDFRYVSLTSIRKELAEQPQKYTAWFKICFEKVVDQVTPFLTAKI